MTLSSCPLPQSTGDMFQDPQFMSETMEATEPYKYCVFSYAFMPMTKFTLYFRHRENNNNLQSNGTNIAIHSNKSSVNMALVSRKRAWTKALGYCDSRFDHKVATMGLLSGIHQTKGRRGSWMGQNRAERDFTTLLRTACNLKLRSSLFLEFSTYYFWMAGECW